MLEQNFWAKGFNYHTLQYTIIEAMKRFMKTEMNIYHSPDSPFNGAQIRLNNVQNMLVQLHDVTRDQQHK